MDYKEVHKAYTAAGYGAINEEPEMFVHMLGKHRLGKMCSIASAGEMLYLAFLPKATSILAVDHSYRSLAASMIKGNVIKKLGMLPFKALVLSGDYNKFCAEVATILDKIPPEVLPHVGINDKAKLTHTPAGTACVSATCFATMKKDYYYANDRLIARTDQMLDKLTFMHGDMVIDAAKEGPFDSVYISNMTEHAKRDGTYAKVSDFFPLLKIGGKLLGTGAAINQAAAKSGWVPLMPNQPAMRTSWQYSVLQNKLTPKFAYETLRGQ